MGVPGGGAKGRASAFVRAERNSAGTGRSSRAGRCVCDCRCTKMHSDAAAVRFLPAVGNILCFLIAF
uniref:Uncharacterized protein n=1 Tax=Sphaerodactylus townsendi TaxID=933632 RepID=A0ACB8E6R7_9SAUR